MESVVVVAESVVADDAADAARRTRVSNRTRRKEVHHEKASCGNWQKSEGGGYDNCGPRCSDDVYDPRQDFCFADTDNPGKYCWYYTDKLPYGNWKGEGGRGYDKCGGYCSAY